MSRVFVIGVGMTKFEKPGRRKWSYPDMVKEAGTKALLDAGIDYSLIEQAYVGYVYGDSTSGQRAVYELGLTGIPVVNVNNNCSTGSTALYLARQAVQGGTAKCVIAVGFEQMNPGSLTSTFTDRLNPMQKFVEHMVTLREYDINAPNAPQMFGNAGRDHMDLYGSTRKHFAKIGQKNHQHSVNNPYSQFQTYYTLDQVESSRKIYDPLTLLQCSPTSDGSAVAILANEEFVRAHNLQHQAVEIIGQAMVTDSRKSFEGNCIDVVGFNMSKVAADKVYQQSGLSPRDVQLVELHDCFSCNELITYEALGLCEIGKGAEIVDRGDNTYGGKWVVNPSGGLISKGHPLGATGIAQCTECCWQLRKMAGKRQVQNARVALQHNIGLGGAVVITMYRLGFPESFRPFPEDKENPAINCQSPTNTNTAL
jgi:acetyl-CoA acetyltransferase